MARTKVFVSYSHDDRIWLERLNQHIAVLERASLVELWSDMRIAAGAEWEREIEAALTSARVAVLLVSPAFLASNFVWTREMPRIEAHSRAGMDVLPLIARPCAWRLEEFLAQLNARPTDGRPLSLGSEGQVDLDLSSFAYELAAKVGKSPAAIAVSEVRPARRDLPPPRERNIDPRGEWSGFYNRNTAIQLAITDVNSSALRGKMTYSGDGTVTSVEGDIHQSWSANDETWSQIADGALQPRALAITFKEIGYDRKGSGEVSFDGEYRALMKDHTMSGAWFSGHRLVGLFRLQRVASSE